MKDINSLVMENLANHLADPEVQSKLVHGAKQAATWAGGGLIGHHLANKANSDGRKNVKFIKQPDKLTDKEKQKLKKSRIKKLKIAGSIAAAGAIPGFVGSVI